MSYRPRPKTSDESSSGGPQHRGPDSLDCRPERYDIDVLLIALWSINTGKYLITWAGDSPKYELWGQFSENGLIWLAFVTGEKCFITSHIIAWVIKMDIFADDSRFTLFRPAVDVALTDVVVNASSTLALSRRIDLGGGFVIV